MKENAISEYQLVLLVFYANVAATILFIPGTPITIVSQDSWLSIMLATVVAAGVVYYPLAKLGAKYPGKSMIEYGEIILGKYIGKVVGLLLVYFFIQVHSWSLREFSELAVVFLPGTPIEVIILAFSLLTSYAVYKGIEVIGRIGEFVFLIGAVSLLIFMTVSSTGIELSNIQPIGESGFLPILRAAIFPLDWLAIGFVFGILSKEANAYSNLTKVGLTAVGLSGVVLTIYSLLMIANIGSEVLAIQSYPFISWVQYAQLVSPLERFEALTVMIWVTWMFMRVAIFSYAGVVSLAQVFKLSDYRFFIFAESLLASAYSIYQYENYTELSFLFSIASPYYLSFSIGIPIILWLASLFHTGKQ